MRKKVIKLTEGELKRLIGKSLKKVLSEGWNSNLSPDALDDKAYMDDMYVQRDKMFNDAWEDKNRRIRQEYPGKSQEWYDAMLDVYEGRKNRKVMNEEDTFQNNQGYSHFAVNKATNKIVNGWDYKEYDPDELRQFKRDYFTVDLIDYGFDPKQYKILTARGCMRQGIDPDDNANWANE